MTLRCPACGRRYEGEERFCTADGSRLLPLEAPSAADALLAGQLLGGRYRVRERVAEGGMAIVYRAEDEATGEALALKALAPVLTGDATAMTRLRREADLGRQLRHPNVCPILAMGAADGGVVYVVMPFLAGETLADRLARTGPLLPDRVAALVHDVAEGLHAAHALGIVHRDLKPENVMVVPAGANTRVDDVTERAVVDGARERAVVDGARERAVVDGARERAVVDGARERAVVMDFGLATDRRARLAARRLTRTGMVMGTPEFMSPEQLRDQPLDARSDVYALALVTCELLTGRLPFPGRNQQEQMLARLRTAPTPLRELRPGLAVPLDVERVMRRGLAIDREDRYPTAPAFAAAFDAALHGAASPR